MSRSFTLKVLIINVLHSIFSELAVLKEKPKKNNFVKNPKKYLTFSKTCSTIVGLLTISRFNLVVNIFSEL